MPKLISDSRPNNPTRIILTLIILILLAGNVFLGVKYRAAQTILEESERALETQKTNEKVLNFTQLFINKVLKAEGEVDFETRLNLENEVRSLDDQEILEQWQKFTESESEAEAQVEVKNLLELLVNKIKI